AAQSADAVLLGAVGGPRWDTTDPARPRPEQGLLGLRKGLGLYANLRPVKPLAALYDASPLRRERIEGTDLLVVRELTGGIYFGDSGRRDGAAFDTCSYEVGEIERIAEVAFRFARRRVTSVDKANVLETSRLWREVGERVAGRHEGTEREDLLVANGAMPPVGGAAAFRGNPTLNLFGYKLSGAGAGPSQISNNGSSDVNTADLIWANGELVPWEDAKVHVLTHGLHYGTGVFEGIRAYDTEIGTAVFRHREHLERLHKSAGLYYME